MKSNKFFGLTSAILISISLISGCQSTMSNPISTPKVVNNNNSTTLINNQANLDYTSSTAKPSAQNFSNEVQDALLMDSEDEKYLDDSDTSLSSDPAFVTKALLPSAKLNLVAKPRKEIKKAILGNGAIERNEKGELIIDKAKLKENFKAVKVVAKKELDKLKRKNNLVRTSDVNEVKNADGSTTKTATVEFENQKTGIKRNIVNVRTVDNGKLENSSHELTATHKNFYRTVKRTLTINDDGSRKIVFYSLVQWKDGRKREVNKETNLDTSGNGTAKGTMVITQKDGKVTNHDINVIITGGVPKTTVTDPVTKTEVALEEKTDGSASFTTKTEGSEPKIETFANVEIKVEELDLQKEENSNPVITPSVSPSPSSSPSAL